MSGKRKDYISWDEYFMGVAVLSGMRSKDPNTQVGACIVSEDHKILSMGYNGFPTGCSDDEFPWEREGEPLENKYFYTTHSELNAILNYRGGSLEGATIYVTLFPCNECAKAIIQSGIRRIVYDSDKYETTPAVVASKKMLNAAGVVLQLSLGIAIQNFPEGAIISMPLWAEGESKSRAFLGGVLSGVVEPIGAVLTILAAQLVIPALPYFLSFAAGAMLYVVVEELIPEMSRKALQHQHGFLCRGLRRHDDAGCGAGIGVEVPLLLRQR